MPRKVSPLLPSTGELLRQLGERLRLARRRRRLSAKRVAARAGMSPMTLRSVERGGSAVTMGAYLAVMQVLGMEKDLELVAEADPLGHSLQDARLSAHRKAAPPKFLAPTPKPRALREPPPPPPEAPSTPSRLHRQPRASIQGMRRNAIEGSSDRVKGSSFTSARALAALLETPSASRARAKRR